MSEFSSSIPERVKEVLARLGGTIEYSEWFPRGCFLLSETTVQDADLDNLGFSPSPVGLDLGRTKIGDVGTLGIGQMAELEYLRLYKTEVTDKGLLPLRDLCRLEWLDLGTAPGCFPKGLRPVPAANVKRSEISDTGLNYLTELTSLSHLRLRASRITDFGLNDCLPELPELTSLDLAYMDVSDESLSGLARLSQLENLNLRHTGFSADGIISLAETHWQNLKRLNVANTAIDNTTLAELPHIFQPTYLNLKDTAVTDNGIRHLANQRQLESLVLASCEVGDDGVRKLEDLLALEWLNLGDTNVTDDCFVWLCQTNLKHLDVSETVVTDSGMPTVTDFAKLHSLDLSKTNVTNRGVRFLQEASKLDTLYLEYSDINADGIPFLKSLPDLQTLSVSPGLQNERVDALSGLLTLKHLAVFDRTPVLHALKNLSSLKTLLLVEPGDIAADLSELIDLHWLLILTKTPDPQLLQSYRAAIPGCSVRFYKNATDARNDFRAIAKHV